MNVELIDITGTLLAGGIGLIALLAALLAAGAGLYFMLYAFGFFNYLGGKKKSDIPPVGKGELMEKILDLNDPSKPYHIVRGQDTDLIAEWKIADANWYGILNRSGLKVSYKARLLLDEARHAVRCYEQFGTIEWSAGMMGHLPAVHFEKSFFGGRILYSKQYAIGYGLKQLKPSLPGKVYQYEFDVNEIRGPLIVTVEENGWEWVPVAAKRHATFHD